MSSPPDILEYYREAIATLQSMGMQQAAWLSESQKALKSILDGQRGLFAFDIDPKTKAVLSSKENWALSASIISQCEDALDEVMRGPGSKWLADLQSRAYGMGNKFQLGLSSSYGRAVDGLRGVDATTLRLIQQASYTQIVGLMDDQINYIRDKLTTGVISNRPWTSLQREIIRDGRIPALQITDRNGVRRYIEMETRVETICRTQTQRVASQGAKDKAKEIYTDPNELHMKWGGIDDGRERKSHHIRFNVIRKLSEWENVAFPADGKIIMPGEDPNCRCWPMYGTYAELAGELIQPQGPVAEPIPPEQIPEPVPEPPVVTPPAPAPGIPAPQPLPEPVAAGPGIPPMEGPYEAGRWAPEFKTVKEARKWANDNLINHEFYEDPKVAFRFSWGKKRDQNFLNKPDARVKFTGLGTDEVNATINNIAYHYSRGAPKLTSIYTRKAPSGAYASMRSDGQLMINRAHMGTKDLAKKNLADSYSGADIARYKKRIGEYKASLEKAIADDNQWAIKSYKASIKQLEESSKYTRTGVGATFEDIINHQMGHHLLTNGHKYLGITKEEWMARAKAAFNESLEDSWKYRLSHYSKNRKYDPFHETFAEGLSQYLMRESWEDIPPKLLEIFKEVFPL